MRVDEKQVDGPDLARAEEQQETLLAEHEEAELPEIVGDVAAHDLAQQRTDKLLAAMKTIFAKQHLNVTHLRLPQRETLALEALQAAVHGRTTNLDRFVFASDRRSLLEQALAVLQPGLVAGAELQIAAMSAELQRVTKQVTELRESLMNLEDGQDELMAEQVFPVKAATAGDKDDEPSDPDAPRPASQLAGPGPEVTHERAPTTLTGRERREEPAPATTLGDPDEIAAAESALPWWRRPVG